MKLLISTLIAFQASQLVLFVAGTDPNEDGPTCGSQATCAQKASSSKWTAENFDFHAEYIYTTPARQYSHGYVKFNLSNTAVAYTAACSATAHRRPAPRLLPRHGVVPSIDGLGRR